MDLVFKKLGNSSGLIFPDSFLRTHNIIAGQVMRLDVSADGSFVLRRKARRYSAKELNEMCDLNASMPPDLLGWDNAPPVGSEEL